MTAEVLPIQPKKKLFKPKIERVQPSHIVDVWRMVRDSILFGNQVYPDSSEDAPELIQDHLFRYLSNPTFGGLIAKSGKKPIGVILGHLEKRAHGRPHHFQFIWCFWVDRGYRGQGVGQALWKEYSDLLRKCSILNWEAHCQEHLEKELCREIGVPVKRLQSIIGGRL